MRYLKVFGMLLVLTLFFITGCENLPFFKKPTKPQKPAVSETQEVTGTVIARVNNMAITLEELNEQVDTINKLADEQKRPQDKIDTRDKKIKYLKDELIRQKLLYQEAIDRGLDRKDAVKRAFDNLKTSLLITELVKDELEKVDVSSSEIEEYYNRYKSQFLEPEERNIKEILVGTESEARQALRSYYDGQDFAGLARQYSKAGTASDGGDVGFIKIPQEASKMIRCDKYYEAAFSQALEVGAVSGIFRCPDGWYIIKLEAKKEGKQKTLAEMWEDIKSGLRFLKQDQRIKEIIAQLQRQAKTEVYEEKVY